MKRRHYKSIPPYHRSLAWLTGNVSSGCGGVWESNSARTTLLLPKKRFFFVQFLKKKKNKKQNHLPTDTTMFFSCLHGQVAQDVAAATRQKGSLIKNYNADGQKRTFEAFFSAEVPHKFI
jgi:hypothetical protein